MEIRLDVKVHTEPVTLSCETYKNLKLVEKKDFTSEYKEDPASNKFIFTFDDSFDNVVCPSKGISFDIFTLDAPFAEGTPVPSYKLYKDYAADKKEGGVVYSFKAARDSNPNTDPMSLFVLSPFAKFETKAEKTCTVEPAVEKFEVYVDEESLMAYGSFKADTEYVVTCPDAKVVVVAEGPKTLITASNFDRNQEEPKVIKFENSAALSTILGSVAIAALALASLF